LAFSPVMMRLREHSATSCERECVCEREREREREREGEGERERERAEGEPHASPVGTVCAHTRRAA
jgi:hypothetical protein